MNGLQRHAHRVWGYRLAGALVIIISTIAVREGLNASYVSTLRGAVRVSVTPSCTVLLEHETLQQAVRTPSNCLMRSSASLPLLWSLGHKKQLRFVTLDELTWISGIGFKLGRRIFLNRHVESWVGLATRARLSEGQLDKLREYLIL